MTPEEFIIAWGKAFLSRAPIIIVLGVTGIVVMVGLLWAWRNHQRRLRRIEDDRQRRHQPQPYTDAWASAAARLEDEAPVDSPESDLPDPPYDEDDLDDAEDDDETPPWER